ncbi:MAG: glycoside hydrolase family 2 TIM barrel-domain containing protein, partial [Chloroflexota bacterium]
VLLNGAPVYLRGALDQAFHPEGLHAYPSDAAVRADVAAAKALGLNLLRCHIKINDPRYYYWCDKLGVLMMYDLPSAGVYTPTAQANWEQTFREALERDYSHPCIFAWILFNETWGLEEHQTPASWNWVSEMFALAKQLDRTRLVEDNSANLYDHVVTDLNTWHFYIADYDRARRHVERVERQTYEGSGFNYVGNLYHYVEGAGMYKQGTEPLLNSEYAGLSARQGDRDISYTFKFLTTELRRHDKICGYVYTELADIEWEHNGFLNYDRTPKEFGYDAFVPGMTVGDVNGADFVGLDCPPCQTLPPGGVFAAPVFISHWDRREIEKARLRWRVTAIDRFGEQQSVDEGERAVRPRRYGVTDAGTVETRLPAEPCLVTVALWLEDGAGVVRARTYVNVDVLDLGAAQASPPATAGQTESERTENGYALRFRPGDFAETSWVTPTIAKQGAKLGATGAGWVEYALPLPEGFDRRAPSGLRLRFEAAARTARRRIGWKDPLHVLATDYPQTEALKLPTDLVVSVNNIALGTVRLPDDPADARGVLTIHLHEPFEFASYGYLTTLRADAATARRILDAATEDMLIVRFEVPRSGTRGGLNLYGARMGAYPFDPTLFLDV